MEASKRKPVVTVESTLLNKPILAIYADRIHSAFLLFAVSESEDDGVCSESKNSVDNEHWVACDQCKLWYHLSCIDLDKIPGPDDAWICSVCSDI